VVTTKKGCKRGLEAVAKLLRIKTSNFVDFACNNCILFVELVITIRENRGAIMLYKTAIRTQYSFLPYSIDEFVGPEDPVREHNKMFDMVIKKSAMYRKFYNCNKTGTPPYDPTIMIKLILYGYACGITSSRKLELAIRRDVAFIWLAANMRPDHTSIARFRSKHYELLKDLLKTSITQDKEEASKGSLVTKEALSAKFQQLLSEKEKTKEKVSTIFKYIEETKIEKINSTDPDSVKCKSRQGIHSSYNCQVTVDGQEGLIVAAEATSQNNDWGQLGKQVQNSIVNTDIIPETSCADSGYSSIEDFRDLSDVSPTTKAIVPSQETIHQEREILAKNGFIHFANKDRSKKGNKSKSHYQREDFTYDNQTDSYRCPLGHVLSVECKLKTVRGLVKQYSNKEACVSCRCFKKCSGSQAGYRKVFRLDDEYLRDNAISLYKSEYGKTIYKQRFTLCERVFGHFKHNLGFRQFRLRGKDKVNGELAILALVYNIKRMINLLKPKDQTYSLAISTG
jgi:transposase